MPDLHQIFVHVTQGRGSVVVWTALWYIMYFRFYAWRRHIAHNGPYRDMSIPLQRVTSLRRRAQDWYWLAVCCLRRILDDGGRRNLTSPSCKESGGGACNAPLPCCKRAATTKEFYGTHVQVWGRIYLLTVVLLGCVASRPVISWRLCHSDSTQITDGCRSASCCVSDAWHCSRLHFPWWPTKYITSVKPAWSEATWWLVVL